MLRKHTKKLRLGTVTIRALTPLQATRVQGGKFVPSDLCTSNVPTVANCDATDNCQLPTG